MAPSTAEAYGSPVRSVTGSASMSPRSSTVLPGLPPRSTAVTELSALPRVISSGRPSSASSTLRWVRGRSRPISGSAWIARRSSVSSAAIATASSCIPPTGHPSFPADCWIIHRMHVHTRIKRAIGPRPACRPARRLGEYGLARRADCLDYCKLPRGRVPAAAGTRGRQRVARADIDEGRGSGREWRRLGYSPRPGRDTDRRLLRGRGDGARLAARGSGARARPGAASAASEPRGWPRTRTGSCRRSRSA